MNKSKKLLIRKVVVLLLAIVAIMLTFKYLPYILELTVSIDKFSNYIISLGNLGSLVFILFQALQIIIAPIPGEIVQAAGGYIYGTLLGTIYALVGMMLGAFIAFYFTRLIGSSFIENLLKKKKFQWLTAIMSSKKFSIILLIFFLVPGLPKDFLIYVAGLTPIKSVKFFGILLVSRLPWLLASASIGSNIRYGNHVSVIVISIIALVSFVFGVTHKDKLISKFSQNKNINS